MKFIQDKSKPLRIYIEGEESEIQRLNITVYNAFHIESEYPVDEEDVDCVIFKDELGRPYFPSGIIGIVKDLAERIGCQVEEKLLPPTDNTVVPDIDKNILSGISLRHYQLDCAKASVQYKRGLLQVPTGGGKTEIMIAVSKYLIDNGFDGNILICVPTVNLLVQTEERMIKRGIDKDIVSTYGGGNELNTNSRIVIATVQTVYSRLTGKLGDDEQRWHDNVGCLIFDESHHCSARTYYTIIDTLPTEYLLGFSAEPFYGSKEYIIRDLILRGTMGPVLYRISLQMLIEEGYLSKPYMIALDSHCPNRNSFKIIDWQLANKTCIVENQLRNDMIRDTAVYLISVQKNPLILVSQIKHGIELAKSISKYNDKKVAMLTGGRKVSIYLNGMVIDEYIDKEDKIKEEFQDGLIDALIGTSVYDEGVDVPSLASVILAGGGKSKLKLLQRIGRGLRPKKDDNTTIIVDFQDKFNVITRKQFRERKVLFDKNNIPVYFARDLQEFSNIVTNIREERKYHE